MIQARHLELQTNHNQLTYRIDFVVPPCLCPNCLFLHAQNKQTVKTIIKPLRKLGIPVAGIVDIDILKEGGVVWSGFLDSGYQHRIL
jgi:hypothetical protein